MFHVELRQFPHVTRAFNLSREELEARIVRPWLRGVPVQWEDRRWAPDRARLKVYEAPQLRPDQIGLGRGWANVTRGGVDVTAEVLKRTAQSERDARNDLSDEVLRRAGGSRIGFDDVLAVVGELRPELATQEQQTIAAQLVLELLRGDRLKLSSP